MKIDDISRNYVNVHDTENEEHEITLILKILKPANQVKNFRIRRCKL